MPRQKGLSNPARKEKYNYGMRKDGTPKGRGWLGELPHINGGVMTEYSVGVDFDGKETLIPSIVPTLTPDELNVIQTIKPNQKIPQSIIDKAVDHARMRIKQGKSPFKD